MHTAQKHPAPAIVTATAHNAAAGIVGGAQCYRLIATDGLTAGEIQCHKQATGLGPDGQTLLHRLKPRHRNQ
ncbi:MAG TPA: hypothetical protein DCP75_18895 [Haliea salexigens]|uniref:Uncharacterized protein n=1 Tax=Haliea salexigens TaxID=287487 RepID=A0A3C1KU79_9GAMM|nr:hypothetical protein [Haliea salexigens]